MRRRSIAAWFGGASVVVACASPYLACNSLTNIDDYKVDCTGCILGACAKQNARCQTSCACLAGAACYQNCAISGRPPEACSTECLPSGVGIDPIAQAMLDCVFTNCVSICFGSSANIPAGVDANLPVPVCDSGARETSTDDGGPSAADCEGKKVGSPMVFAAVTPASRSFCIDQFETTIGEYNAFLAVADPPTTPQPTECSWNTSFAANMPTPDGGTRPDDVPVFGVDWCDALAYCNWAGKHLCGGMTGAPFTPGDTFADQWMYACQSGGASSTKYPYGAAYVSGKCNDSKTAPGTLHRRGTDVSCVGTAEPYARLQDMSGNVAEWDLHCEGGAGATDICDTRGGNMLQTDPQVSCPVTTTRQRNDTNPADLVGIRCCAF